MTHFTASKLRPLARLTLAAAVAIPSLLLSGCQENGRVMYTDKPAVYFSSLTQDDSLTYSFASGLHEKDTVRIPVRIIGESVGHDRTFAVVADAATTATEGVNYNLLTKTVTLPADSVNTTVDVEVINRELSAGDKSVVLNLLSGDDFALGYATRLTARLVITDQLVKPTYWSFPLQMYYGSYSKAKHRLCIQLQGFDFPPVPSGLSLYGTLSYLGDYIGQFMVYGRLVYNYLQKTPIWDEDTQTWITADWSPM